MTTKQEYKTKITMATDTMIRITLLSATTLRALGNKAILLNNNIAGVFETSPDDGW